MKKKLQEGARGFNKIKKNQNIAITWRAALLYILTNKPIKSPSRKKASLESR